MKILENNFFCVLIGAFARDLVMERAWIQVLMAVHWKDVIFVILEGLDARTRPYFYGDGEYNYGD